MRLKPDHQSPVFNKRIVVRASNAPYIVFGVILGVVGILSLALGLVMEPSFVKPGVTFLAAYGIVVLSSRHRTCGTHPKCGTGQTPRTPGQFLNAVQPHIEYERHVPWSEGMTLCKEPVLSMA